MRYHGHCGRGEVLLSQHRLERLHVVITHTFTCTVYTLSAEDQLLVSTLDTGIIRK